MEIDKTIDELLSQEKGIKKCIRKVVYRAMAPLLCKLQVELLKKLSASMTEIDDRLLGSHSRMNTVEINIRNNNDILKNLQNESVRHDNELKRMLEYTLTLGELVKKQKAAVIHADTADSVNTSNTSNFDGSKEQDIASGSSEDSYEGIDYFDFENRFRGSREDIKKVQEQYIQYYAEKKKVVDIGCGRGEFLELLNDHNIGAIGIDLYGKSIECCKLMGLNVLQQDAIRYLERCDSVDGVFAGQLVEHLTIGQIIKLCEVVYEKLEDDCYMILETPNPTSLAIYTHAFYMDPSHGKPVHPLTLQYCAEKAGFKDVKILYTESSLLPASIPKLEASNIENLKEFNDAMEIVSGTLFGSQDYAIIARK